MVQKKSFGLFCLIFLFIFVEMHSQNMPNLTLSREKFIPIYPLNNANLNGPRLGIKILPEMPSGCITENRIVLECINCLYNNGINYISFDLFFEDCSGVKWKKGVSLPANSSSSISIGGKAFVNNQREQVIFGLDNSNKFNGHFTYKAESPGVITNIRITNRYEGTDNQKVVNGNLNASQNLDNSLSKAIIPIYNALTDTSGYYAYVNSISGKIISKFYYEEAFQFINGLARVKRNGLYGFINYLGDEVINCRFIEADDFNDDGFAIVTIGTKFSHITSYKEDWKQGVVDKSGLIVLPFEYKFLGDLKDNRAIAQDLSTEKWGIIDISGKWRIAPKFDKLGDFHNGLARVNRNGLYGFINYLGVEVINCRFIQAGDFNDDGFAIVTIGNIKITEKFISYENEKQGVIDKSGRIVIPFEYKSLGNFKYNRAIAQDFSTEKWGIIDISGKWRIEPKFDGFGFRNTGNRAFDDFGMIRVVIKYGNYDERYGLIDSMGNFLIYPKYVELIESENYFLAKIEDKNQDNYKWGLLNRKGQILIDFKYKHIDKFQDNLALVENFRGKFGFVNMKGEEIIPLVFEYAEPFKGDLALVRINGKFGWIDKSGNYIINCIYDIVFTGEESTLLAIVSRNGYWGALNLKGEEFIPVIYDEIHAGLNYFWSIYKEKERFVFNIKGESLFKENIDSGYYKIKANGFNNLTLNSNKKENNIKLNIGDYISSIRHQPNGFFIVSESNKYGIRHFNDNSLFCPILFDSIMRIPSVDPTDCIFLLGYLDNNLYFISSKFSYFLKRDSVLITPTDYSTVENYQNFDRERPSYGNKGNLVGEESRFNFIRVKKGNIYGYILIKDLGIYKMLEPIYEDIGAFPNKTFKPLVSSCLIAVKKNGLWGFVECETGELKIAYQYQNVGGFNNGLDISFVKNNNKWGLIDKSGNLVTSFLFDDGLRFNYRNKLIPVKTNGKWGFIDKYGVSRIPFIFDEILDIDEHQNWQYTVKLNKEVFMFSSFQGRLQTFFND